MDKFPLEKAKDFLETFWDLMHRKDSVNNIMTAIQELGDKVQPALDELYEAEREFYEQQIPVERRISA